MLTASFTGWQAGVPRPLAGCLAALAGGGHCSPCRVAAGESFLIFHSPFQCVVAFPQLTYFDLFWCYRRGFWCFALTLITQLFDPSCHCGKANIHSFGGICHRVFLVNNQLSGFAFKFCAKISFSLEHLCCSEVSISPLFRWPNSVCHFKYKRTEGCCYGIY